VIDTMFDERHFREWLLWRGEADTGTLLAVSDIAFDLTAQLERRSRDEPEGAVRLARERLFHLSQFTDPYADESGTEKAYGGEFSVRSRPGRVPYGDRLFQRTVVRIP